MGLESINTFEAKIAAGNGEQVLSREVRRLGNKLEFCRLLTWYHTGSGFFVNTSLTMLGVLSSVWTILFWSVLRLLGQGSNVTTYLGAVQILQLGTLSVIGFWFTKALEEGVIMATWAVVRQLVQGSAMFFIFRSQTTASGFITDLLFGGAKYAATGRGYKLASSSVIDLYERFGRSHMYLGAVLLVYCLVALLAMKTFAYAIMLWAPLLVSAALLFGPFWFTPLSFRTKHVLDDATKLQTWLLSSADKHSWWSWNKEQRAKQRNINGKQLARLLKGVLLAFYNIIPIGLLVLAIIARLYTEELPDELPFDWEENVEKAPKAIVYCALLACWVVPSLFASAAEERNKAVGLRTRWRWVVILSGFVMAAVLVASFLIFRNSFFWTAFSALLLLRLLPLLNFTPVCKRLLWGVVDSVYYLADVSITMILIGVRFVLSFGDIVTAIQQQLLFNSAWSSQVVHSEDMQSTQTLHVLKELLALKKQAVSFESGSR